MNRGKFDRLITVQRATVTTDDYGGETSTWADMEQAYARVRFGTGQERREAAQVRATQTATFEVQNPSSVIRSAVEKDRIFLHEDSTTWDITASDLMERNLQRFASARSR